MRSELARYRVDDLIRAAEAERLAKATRHARKAQKRSAPRRSGFVLALLLPFRR